MLGDRTGGVDCHNLVLLLELVDDRLVRPTGHRLNIESAVKPCIGHEHADLLSPLLADRGDRPDNFVLHRQAAINERHDHLVQAAHEGDTQEYVFYAQPAAGRRPNRSSGYSELLLGLGGFGAVVFGVVDAHDDAVTADRIDLSQHREEVEPCLNVLLWNLGADVGFDVHRSVAAKRCE